MPSKKISFKYHDPLGGLFYLKIFIVLLLFLPSLFPLSMCSFSVDKMVKTIGKMREIMFAKTIFIVLVSKKFLVFKLAKCFFCCCSLSQNLCLYLFNSLHFLQMLTTIIHFGTHPVFYTGFTETG